MDENQLKKLTSSLQNEIVKMEDGEKKQAAMMRLQEIAKVYQGDDKVISSTEIAEEMKNNPPKDGILTGFKAIDALLRGFIPQQLVVLSGITKHGKTSFAIELTMNMARENPVWFPFEESASELIQKFIDAKVPIPIFFTPQRIKNRSLEWIESKIVEAKAKYGSQIAFIDHLEFIEYLPSNDNNRNHTQELDRVVYALKALAQKWDVTIVLLCHLTKAEIDKHPNLQDLRGTAAIAQVADTVMFVWRETTKDRKSGEIKMTNVTNISIQANRRTGKTGNIKLAFGDADRRYHEPEYSEFEHPAYDPDDDPL